MQTLKHSMSTTLISTSRRKKQIIEWSVAYWFTRFWETISVWSDTWLESFSIAQECYVLYEWNSQWGASARRQRTSCHWTEFLFSVKLCYYWLLKNVNEKSSGEEGCHLSLHQQLEQKLHCTSWTTLLYEREYVRSGANRTIDFVNGQNFHNSQTTENFTDHLIKV